MSETLEKDKWRWYHIMDDLERIGLLKKVVIYPLSEKGDSYEGRTREGIYFSMSWGLNSYLILVMDKKDTPLIKAFSTVIEYSPFCEYINKDGRIVIEWDKVDPDNHFARLQATGAFSNLIRLN